MFDLLPSEQPLCSFVQSRRPSFDSYNFVGLLPSDMYTLGAMRICDTHHHELESYCLVKHLACCDIPPLDA